MGGYPIVDKNDNRKGMIAGIISLLFVITYIMMITFEIADPPPQPVMVEMDTQIPEIELKNLTVEGGSGSGKPNDAPVQEPKPQTEKIATKTESETTVNTGESNHTNAPVSDNQNSTTEQSNNPFASGGSGDGDSGGSGDTFGGDSGIGTGGNGGKGSGKGRVRLNDPIMTDLKSNVDATIYLKLTIDAEGNVISAYNIKSKTTTTNQILINRVIHEVKKQVKYNKDPGAPLAKVFMSVVVKAQ